MTDPFDALGFTPISNTGTPGATATAPAPQISQKPSDAFDALGFAPMGSSPETTGPSPAPQSTDPQPTSGVTTAGISDAHSQAIAVLHGLGNPLIDIAATPVQAIAKMAGLPDPYANGALGGYNVSSIDKPLEKAGSALQVGMNFVPGLGEESIASRLGGGFLTKTALAAQGAGIGYGYDVGSNLKGGATGADAFTPGMGTLVGLGAPIAAEIATPALKSLFPTADSLTGGMVADYNKGVKPSIAGVNTIGAAKKMGVGVVDAINAITDNAPSLSFTNDVGEKIVGQTPKTLQQLQDAVEQTKSVLFQKYDALAQQAGEAGVKVNLSPIASQLDDVINNKALQLTNPRAVAYAEATKERFLRVGSVDASTAQEIIKNYNESLKAFYRNPSYDTATNAGIDAMLANNMRTALDTGISNITGAGYQALKNQYGALSSIEKDVVKATLRNSKLSNKGLLDFTDIFTGADLAHGLVTMNPAEIIQGATGRGVKEIYKYLNSPDRAIASMFKKSQRLLDLSKSNAQTAITKASIHMNDTVPELPAPVKGSPSSQNFIPVKVNPTQEQDISRGFPGGPSLKGFIKPEVAAAGALAGTVGAYGAAKKMGVGTDSYTKNAESTPPLAGKEGEIKTLGTVVDPVTKQAKPVSVQTTSSPAYQRYAPIIKKAEDRVQKELGVTLPKGFLTTVLGQESSMGTDSSSANTKLGKNAWLVGLTKGAEKELDKAGIKYNVDTPQGAVEAAALYAGLRLQPKSYDKARDLSSLDTNQQQKYTSDPALFYAERYRGETDPKMKQFYKDLFDKKLGYYSQN